MHSMWTASTVDSCRDLRRSLKGSVALVPTMGALHPGHASLITAGKKIADHVIVTIFVNPTQFGPHEDFSRYPRPLDKDLHICKEAGASGVFVPSVEVVYPPENLPCDVVIPALADVLEGEFRPGHFAGVCRVVNKLLNITLPDMAMFGEKDRQQLRVIRAMVDDLFMPVKIVGVPTMREPDGLAMSSRNVYLDADGRHRAIALYKALSEAKELIEVEGEIEPEKIEHAMEQVLTTRGLTVDYAVIRHPHTLMPLEVISPATTQGVLALIAARVGTVRLIDNMLLGNPQK